MNLRTAVMAGAAGVAAIVVTATLSGPDTMHLPLPQAAADVRLPAHTGAGGTGAVRSSTTTTLPGSQTTYTIASPVPLTSCTVTVSNPSPVKSQTAETATIRTTPGAQVALVASYSSHRSAHSAIVGTSGVVSIGLPISHAPVGITVLVDVVASLRGVKVPCQASFTPVP